MQMLHIKIKFNEINISPPYLFQSIQKDVKIKGTNEFVDSFLNSK